VADAVWSGIQRRKRNVYVPWLSKVFIGVDFVAPRVMDWYCRRAGSSLPQRDVDVTPKRV
jgi:hypothetical protein